MLLNRCLLAVVMAAAFLRPAAAATCLEQVEALASSAGLAKSLPNVPGLSGNAAAATGTTSSPSSSSSLLSQFGGGGSSGQSASQQVQAASLLQSAKSDSAKGDEQGCLTQLGQARELLGSK